MTKNNVKYYVLGGLFIIALFAFFFFSGILSQSVLSAQTRAQLQNGDVVWIASLTASNVDDGVGFSVNPAPYVYEQSTSQYPVGTKVTPKDIFVVYFSRGTSYCTYRVISSTRTNIFGLRTLNYYVLSNPELTSNVLVGVDGSYQTLDATVMNKRLTFSSNGGSIVVESQGVVSGKKDCYQASNTALYITSTGEQVFVGRSDLEGRFTSLQGIFTNYDGFVKGLARDTAFTSEYSLVSVSSDRSSVKGTIDNGALFSAGLITVTADAKAFKSTFLIPPKTCKPSVSLSTTDIQEASSGNAKLSVSSDAACEVNYDVSITRGTVTPSSGSFSFTSASSMSKNLIIQASSKSGSAKLTVKACSGTQYAGDTSCDTESSTINYLQKSDSNDLLKCGDGVCSASIGEDSGNCPNDCVNNAPTEKNDSALSCTNKFGGLVFASPSLTQSCNLWCKWGISEPKIVNTCTYDYTLLIIVMVLLIVVCVVIYLVKRSKRKK